MLRPFLGAETSSLKWKPQWIISLICTVCLASLKSQEEVGESEEKPSEGNCPTPPPPHPHHQPGLFLTSSFNTPCRNSDNPPSGISLGARDAKANWQSLRGWFKDGTTQIIHPFPRWIFVFLQKDLEKQLYSLRLCCNDQLSPESWLNAMKIYSCFHYVTNTGWW